MQPPVGPHGATASTTDVVGVIIAGGRSTRFGGEKAVALLVGRPLLVWAAERLRTHCGRVAANIRGGSEAERVAIADNLAPLYDEAGDALGPLAGIKVGLQWASRRGARLLAVSPCDVPLLPDDLYARLIASAKGRGAMAQTCGGPQPLCSVWPVEALPAVRQALAHGAHPSIWRLLDSIGATRVHFEAAEAFANVNTPADLAAIAQRLAAPPTTL